MGPGASEELGPSVFDPRIPEDRRVLYALEFLTGMRTGEAAARRWEDWADVSCRGRLVARTAYDTRHRIVKTTKTRVEKWIPVPPPGRRRYHLYRDCQFPDCAMAVAGVTRHSPSPCLREIGRYAVILGERQHLCAAVRAIQIEPEPTVSPSVSPW